MPRFRISALNFFPPIIKKHVWRTHYCRLPLWAGCWGERRDNTCGLELKHSRSANNLLSLNFKTSPLARAANKLTEDSACTNITQRSWDVLQRMRRAGTFLTLFKRAFYDPWATAGPWRSLWNSDSLKHTSQLVSVFSKTVLCTIWESHSDAFGDWSVVEYWAKKNLTYHNGLIIW